MQCKLIIKFNQSINLFDFAFVQISDEPHQNFVWLLQIASIDAGNFCVKVNQNRTEAEAESVFLLDVSVRTLDQLDVFLLELVVDVFKLERNKNSFSNSKENKLVNQELQT